MESRKWLRCDRGKGADENGESINKATGAANTEGKTLKANTTLLIINELS